MGGAAGHVGGEGTSSDRGAAGDADIGVERGASVGTDRAAAHVVAGRQNDLAVDDIDVRRGIEADIAGQQHRHGLVLRNRDHVDSVIVSGDAGARRPAGGAGVHDRLRIVAAGADYDIEQALVDAEADLFAGDISDRAVHPGRAGMIDDRGDHGDVAVLAGRDDGRAALGDDGGIGIGGAVIQLEAVRADEVALAIIDDIEGGEDQVADVEHCGRADDDSAGAREEHGAAGHQDTLKVAGAADDAPVEPRWDAGENPVEDGEIEKLAARLEIERIACRQEHDLAGRGRVRRPVDDRAAGLEGDRLGPCPRRKSA